MTRIRRPARVRSPLAPLALLAVVGLTALVSGCSSPSGTTTDPRPAVAASSSPSTTTATGTTADGDAIAVQVRAALRRSASVTITTGTTTGTDSTAHQDLLVSYSPSSVSFQSMSAAKGFDDPVDGVAELIDPTTLRDVGGTLFMAANQAKLPGAWLRIRPAAKDEWGTFLRQNLSATLRNTNPYVIATMFEAADSVWPRSADGSDASLTRYQVVLKGQNILKVMSADDADRLKNLVTGLTQICEITLDGEGRPVSLSISVGGSSVTQSQTYAGWGPAVTITAPTGGSVMDTPMLATLGYSTTKVQLTKP